ELKLASLKISDELHQWIVYLTKNKIISEERGRRLRGKIDKLPRPNSLSKKHYDNFIKMVTDEINKVDTYLQHMTRSKTKELEKKTENLDSVIVEKSKIADYLNKSQIGEYIKKISDSAEQNFKELNNVINIGTFHE